MITFTISAQFLARFIPIMISVTLTAVTAFLFGRAVGKAEARDQASQPTRTTRKRPEKPQERRRGRHGKRGK